MTVTSGHVSGGRAARGAPRARVPGGCAAHGDSPYGADFTLAAAGDVQALLIDDHGNIRARFTMSVPAATYEVRSIGREPQRDGATDRRL